MATISGFVGENDARVVVIDTTTWLVEKNEIKDFGNYSFTGLTSNQKIVLFIRDDGELIGFGKVSPY